MREVEPKQTSIQPIALRFMQQGDLLVSHTYQPTQFRWRWKRLHELRTHMQRNDHTPWRHSDIFEWQLLWAIQLRHHCEHDLFEWLATWYVLAAAISHFFSQLRWIFSLTFVQARRLQRAQTASGTRLLLVPATQSSEEAQEASEASEASEALEVTGISTTFRLTVRLSQH